MARDAVAEVRDRTDIVELVGLYVQLKRAGRSYKGLCPFHQEKTPSFIVFPDSQNFHCFGCGKGGDVFTFYQSIEHVEFREALQELARRAGVELSSVPTVAPEADAHRARLLEVIDLAAGFPLVWSSSFAVSAAQRAMPDVNLLTMTENLETARYINDAVSIPVIADADNGYGNAVNVVRTVEEYERAGIAGLCMEDNIFPKKCSLYPGMRRELLSIEEFAGKIRAAVASRRDPDFVVIARVDAKTC